MTDGLVVLAVVVLNTLIGMATLHEDGEQRRHIFLKGAPEVVLRRCQLGEGLSAARVLAEVERLAGAGMRVLAMASKAVPATHSRLEPGDVAGWRRWTTRGWRRWRPSTNAAWSWAPGSRLSGQARHGAHGAC